MKTIKGTYTSANVMVDEIDEKTEEQIITICSQAAFKDAKIRIMADTHAGKGVPIGFTAICDKNCVIPNLVGVDISCTVSAWKIANFPESFDFQKLDDIIRCNIPSGNSVRQTPHKYVGIANLDEAIRIVSKEIGLEDRAEYFINSIGTLGGGNHFISVEKDSIGNHWLLIHTGSRNFGYEICAYHQNLAAELLQSKNDETYAAIINSIEPTLRQNYIQQHKKEMVNSEYAYLSGADADYYLKHVKIAELFATRNHIAIMSEICDNLNWTLGDRIITNHNYIETLDDDKICIRKGAVSAKSGQQLLIPLNMADGTLICKGKGNENWNNSAPHGAGRLMSRNVANETLSMDDFENSMKNVWSSCVKKSTLDESPMAYKNADFIINNIGEVVDIVEHLKPVYNYKAS